MIGEANRPLRASIAKGLLCGLVGGLVGSVAKVAGEKLYNPRTQAQTPPPVVRADKIAGHRLPPVTADAAMQTIHYTFGGATGAVYGVVAEFLPVVTAGQGTAFGVVLQLLTHESLVPALGLDVPPWRQPLREHTSELFTHVLYGVAAELTRRWLRRLLG